VLNHRFFGSFERTNKKTWRRNAPGFFVTFRPPRQEIERNLRENLLLRKQISIDVDEFTEFIKEETDAGKNIMAAFLSASFKRCFFIWVHQLKPSGRSVGAARLTRKYGEPACSP
jgi:hypothetical protein